VEHYENLGLPPVAKYLHQPKYSPDKGTILSNIKREMQRFSVFDCIALLYKDT
jgi:hypothetical protein